MLSIRNQTRQKVPSVPFSKITDHVLGPKYDLSLVFVGDTVSKRLNTTYRNKPKPTNILSFPYDKNSGEIFIHLARVQKEAKKYDQTYYFRLAYLLIHGLLHLKGFDHGSKMESKEVEIIDYFGLEQANDKKHRHGIGYRNVLD